MYPTEKEIDEHMMEERQRDKRYFPISGLTIPQKTKYFDINEWLEYRRELKNGK